MKFLICLLLLASAPQAYAAASKEVQEKVKQADPDFDPAKANEALKPFIEKVKSTMEAAKKAEQEWTLSLLNAPDNSEKLASLAGSVATTESQFLDAMVNLLKEAKALLGEKPYNIVSDSLVEATASSLKGVENLTLSVPVDDEEKARKIFDLTLKHAKKLKTLKLALAKSLLDYADKLERNDKSEIEKGEADMRAALRATSEGRSEMFVDIRKNSSAKIAVEIIKSNLLW